MPIDIAAVRARVAAQKTALPALYGDVDFDAVPERIPQDPADSVAETCTTRGSSARA